MGDDLDRKLTFLQAASALKDTLRSARTIDGRSESTAEHSWSFALACLVFAEDMNGVNVLHLVKLALIHDLGEAVSGDIPAIHQGKTSKAAEERRDFVALIAALPPDLAEEFLALWDEYEAAETPEAQMAKGLDKIDTMLQHVWGRNAPDFDYAFNLDYGKQHTERTDLTRRLRRRVDAMTRAEMTK